MIDIFDIIGNQKTVHINIKGEVSSDGLFFDIEYINELTNLLLDNQQDVDFKIFDIKEYKDAEPIHIDRFGTYGSTYQYERTISNIEFHIDVHITNRLNKKIDESMQDFIDFFTKGAIVYNPNRTLPSFMVDAHEDYMSSPLDDGLLSYMYSWEEDNNEWSGIGSYPLERHHDADGDISVFTSSVTIPASRLMGMSGMPLQIDPGYIIPGDIIDRPVRGGNF